MTLLVLSPLAILLLLGDQAKAKTFPDALNCIAGTVDPLPCVSGSQSMTFPESSPLASVMPSGDQVSAYTKLEAMNC